MVMWVFRLPFGCDGFETSRTISQNDTSYNYPSLTLINMLSSTATILPATFVPTEHHVIIGRGRKTKMHNGNRKFHKTLYKVAREYSSAPCKADKGSILTQLITSIHQQGPNAGFIRKDAATGRWTLVEEALARQTAAQAIRNLLSGEYRSSKQFKQQRRMQQIKEHNGSSNSLSSGPGLDVSANNVELTSLLITVSDESLRQLAQSGNMAVPGSTQGSMTLPETDTFILLSMAFATRVNPTRPLSPLVDALHRNVLSMEPLTFQL